MSVEILYEYPVNLAYFDAFSHVSMCNDFVSFICNWLSPYRKSAAYTEESI
jgi:hypothetical protein